MLKSVSAHKSKHSCAVCARRKVKCDRLIPCGNCVKRGTEDKCGRASGEDDSDAFERAWFRFWQSYEYWVLDIGLFKTKRLRLAGRALEAGDETALCEYMAEIITQDRSFRLLDYSIEKLGALYFGCVIDLAELHLLLEQYWLRRENTLEENYQNALLWSIFTLSVYYMSLEELDSIIPTNIIHEWLSVDASKQTSVWTESLQTTVVGLLTRCTLCYLRNANVLANPDIRLVQSFLILTNTMFIFDDPLLSNNMLMQTINVANIYNVNNFKSWAHESAALRLTKATCEKIWYKLCTTDYLLSNPGKAVNIHTELYSVLQHAAYYEDKPNVDVYQSENTFEVFLWKIMSLNRDLDQYLSNGLKPPLKTLDALKRETSIFHDRADMIDSKDSMNSRFEKFLATYLINFVSWNLYKSYFIYYNTSDSMELTIHYAKVLVSMLVHNHNVPKIAFFNKHPLVCMSMARLVPFYTFAKIWHPSDSINDFYLDMRELALSLPSVFGKFKERIEYVVNRFKLLEKIWSKTKVIDSGNSFDHPVIKILQDDIATIRALHSKVPPLFLAMEDNGSKKRSHSELEELDHQDAKVRTFKLIIQEFESEHSIDEIIS